MAISWKRAQQNEERFWKKIYVERHDDATYSPATESAAFVFAKKSLERFGHTFDSAREKVVADVGCGPYGLIVGFYTYMRQRGVRPLRLYGLDPLISTYLGFESLPRDSWIEYVESKAESMPLGDASCDYVYSTNVIDHVEDPGAVLRECLRVCKSSGEVLFAVHVVRFPFTALRPILFLIDKNHPHHFSKNSVTALARKCSRSVVVTRKVSMLEDHPGFTFANALRSPNILRGLRRWLSTFVLCTYYLRCSK